MSKFNLNNHIVGKVYDLTQENMNKMISSIEALDDKCVELSDHIIKCRDKRIELAKDRSKAIRALVAIKKGSGERYPPDDEDIWRDRLIGEVLKVLGEK